MICFIDTQQMGVLLLGCTMPDMDFLAVKSAAWSASE